jgi:hypothetical protein
MTLAHWSLLLGALLSAGGIFILTARTPATRLTRGFARHVWTGRLLATAAWIWAGWATYTMPLDMLTPIRPWLPLLALTAIPLSWYWMADLLSCRALGGLLVLFPCPLLQAARSEPSPWRLVLVSLTYLGIIAGMWLLLYPYQLRRWLAWSAAQPGRMLATGATGAALGACLLVLGLSVFQ